MPPLLTRFTRGALVIVAVAAFLFLYSSATYLFIVHRRMTGDLLAHSWRVPTEIYSAAGKGEPRRILRLYGREWRATEPVRLHDLPAHIPNAFLAAEDVRFRRHIGVDPLGMLRALVANIRRGAIAQGGSTLDQQLIKSRYLTYERTYRRKILEILLAVNLDSRMSKNDILEAYLNDIYLGHVNGRAVLGIDEAARIYFDSKPEKLTVAQAALLASMVRAPNRDTPAKRPDVARSRRADVLETMQRQKWITREEYDEAFAAPVKFRHGSTDLTPYPYYLSAVRREIAREEGARILNRTGLRITCEIDPQMQEAAEEAVRRGTRALRTRYSWLAKAAADDPLQAAALSVDPENGGIRALVGGADFRSTTLDRTLNMKRQPGSAFKPFAFLAAIDTREVTPATLLLDAPLEIELTSRETWSPHNYDEKYRGRVTVREALEKSLNVPTVRVTRDIGISKVARTAEEFGFASDMPRVPALPLGVTEVTMRELTAAYTAFPNLGERVEPFLVRQIRDLRGKTLYEREVKRKRVAEAAPVFVVHSLLRGVVKRGTATRLKRYGLGHIAGKTGTTNDYRDAWFVGYSPDLVTTVWVGFDRGVPLRLSSAEAALPIWAAYMRDVPTDRGDLAAPEGVVHRDIDPETGYLWAEGCPGPFREVFLSGTAPTQYCPRGFLGRIVRRVFFDADSFDEPAAITFDKFRRWSTEAEQSRRRAESRVARLRRLLGGDDRDEERDKARRKEKNDNKEKNKDREKKKEKKEKKEKKGKRGKDDRGRGRD